jgi:hypothetical protein
MPHNTLLFLEILPIMIEPNKNSYNNPIQYTKTPLISGYISKEKLALLKKQFLFNKGDGNIVFEQH